jgi:putative transposase
MADPRAHQRRSIRLKGYDYAQPGAYFVTICTADRQPILGEIVNGAMRLSAAGRIVEQEWRRLVRHFRNIRLDAYVIMPNHLHGIIVINESVEARLASQQGIVGATHADQHEAIIDRGGSPVRDGSPEREGRPKGPGAGSLGAMIGQFKSRVTRRIWSLAAYDHIPIWHRNYYEHIIRNELEWGRICEYIHNNPACWAEDLHHPNRPEFP